MQTPIDKYLLSERLKDAKLRLYKALLDINNEDLSDNDVDIMFQLCLDSQVQSHFSDAIALEQANGK